MKNFTPIVFLFTLISSAGFAQTSQVADQNPQYRQSQDKYMAMSDSVTKWHGTTLQNTYKAYDFLEAKAERKADRKNYKRNLRLTRSRQYGYNNNYDSYYNRRYNSYYNSYSNPYRRWYRW